ncbi:MAG: hypothetical protein R3D98_15820 [Candidatus Krumholzibacteriia bacterium]
MTMRYVNLLLILALAAPGLAYDLGNTAPPKASSHHTAPTPDPQVLRQGGDTLADAVHVDFPFAATGTTVGYTDDYDEACPYTQSTSPDVVYTFSVPHDIWTFIDMYGSTYDTKIYVYDEDLELVACNDDYYPDYVSRIENLLLLADVTYYLVIDGYGGDSGQYVVDTFWADDWCILEPEPGMVLEGEPALHDGYEDAYNGGCNSPQFGNPFGVLDPGPDVFGTSGWYLSADGSQARDTDWFVHQLGPAGTRTITADAEEATYVFELGPQDCGTVGVLQSVEVGPCEPGELTITGEPFSTVWIWVGPTTFDGDGEYDYILRLEPEDPVAGAAQSWSAVKGLFD